MTDYVETLLWILDGPSHDAWDEDENKERIDFVHSIGQKCDCVGWSELNLNQDDAENILSQIQAFCKEKGWKARGWYTREYLSDYAEWYCLNGDYWKDNECADSNETVPLDGTSSIGLPKIKAYTILDNGPKRDYKYYYVSDQFRKKCDSAGIGGIRYCWIKDIGKYQGEQYFMIAPEIQVPHLMRDLRYSYTVSSQKQVKHHPVYGKIVALGGWLPRIAEIFYDLTIALPTSYLKKDMPAEGIGYAFIGQTFTDAGKNEILFRKDVAQKLVEIRALPKCALKPVFVCEEPIPGYVFADTEPILFPNDRIVQERMNEYRMLQSKERPARIIGLKDAVRLLRKSKKERPEDYGKSLSKPVREKILQTAFAPLEPYYAVCGSGYLSDEYELLHFDTAVLETEEFHREMAAEELVFSDVSGSVFAKCPDGDRIVLSASGEVLRMSHEKSTAINRWKDLHHFIAEALVSD